VWPSSVDCLHAVNMATVNLYASSVAYPELQVTLRHVALVEHLPSDARWKPQQCCWTTSLQLNLKVFLVCLDLVGITYLFK
jgi:hypothetical protein